MPRLPLFALALLALAPASAQTQASGGLQRALASVDARTILADVRFLSSEELGGRDTPSLGLRIAARYLGARAEAIGLLPAGTDGFLARYEWGAAQLDLAGTSAAFAPEEGSALELVFGEDYFFLVSGIVPLELQGALVSVGGASARELHGLELSGRIALVRDPPEESWPERLGWLREAGAAGLVLAPASTAAGESYERQAARMRSQAERRLPRTELDQRPIALLTPLGVERLGLSATSWPRAGTTLGAWHDQRRLAPEEETPANENVVALWPGSDPALAHEVLLVSAHYDHLGEVGGVVHPGADDNASGCSALLALGEALVGHGPLRRSVALLWVAGEEHGLQGSWAWANEPSLPAGLTPIANLNLDMVGRNAPGHLTITPSRAHPRHNVLVEWLERFAPLEGFAALVPDDEAWNRSDQLSFAQVLGIPVAALSSGEHEDYHAPGDTWDKVDEDKVARVTRLVLRSLVALDGAPQRRAAPAAMGGAR